MWPYCKVFLVILRCVCGPTGGSRLKPVLTGPSKAYLRSQVQFHCEVPGWASPLTFELRKDTGDLLRAENNVKVTFRLQVTEGSEGKYYCRVTEGQTSNSIQFHVVSEWNQNFIVIKNDEIQIYFKYKSETEMCFCYCVIKVF